MAGKDPNLKTIKCRSCGKIFETKKTARYARKYCEKCSKENKKYYDNLHTVKFSDCEDDEWLILCL